MPIKPIISNIYFTVQRLVKLTNGERSRMEAENNKKRRQQRLETCCWYLLQQCTTLLRSSRKDSSSQLYDTKKKLPNPKWASAATKKGLRLTCDRNHELVQWMCTGYGCYRDQVVDEAVGVGNKVARTDFDVQCDGALTQNVLERREDKNH